MNENVLSTDIKNLGVKFYASKTYAEALALATLPGNAAEPGAICFVSDNTGNYIIVDGKIFGDGTTGGGGGGTGTGDVISVNGKKGVVVLTLSDFAVVTSDGTTIKTLADYFNNDGSVISDEFKVQVEAEDSSGNKYMKDAVVIDANGIKIDTDYVATQAWTQLQITSANQALSTQLKAYADNVGQSTIQDAKDYADSLLTTIYKVKGSVQTYTELTEISNPSAGDVYNVVNAYGVIGNANYIPPGTNYVYIPVTDQEDRNYPGYWDPLGGTIDLSNYYTKFGVDSLLSNLSTTLRQYTDTAKQDVVSQINTVGSEVSSIRTNVENIQTTVSSHGNQISQNINNINNISTQLTWQ